MCSQNPENVCVTDDILPESGTDLTERIVIAAGMHLISITAVIPEGKSDDIVFCLKETVKSLPGYIRAFADGADRYFTIWHFCKQREQSTGNLSLRGDSCFVSTAIHY